MGLFNAINNIIGFIMGERVDTSVNPLREKTKEEIKELAREYEKVRDEDQSLFLRENIRRDEVDTFLLAGMELMIEKNGNKQKIHQG